MMHTTAILLSWHDEENVLEQVRALASWRHVQPDIRLVRNEANPDAPPVANVTPIDLSGNHGYAGGINAGLASVSADTEVILLINNDADVSENAMSTMIRHMESHPEVGLIGPVLVENDNRCYGGCNPLHHVFTRLYAVESPGSEPLIDVAYVPGTVALMRATAWKHVGTFDERFFFSGEIADWCRRAQTTGYRCVIAADAEARHNPADEKGLRATLYRYYTLRNRFLLARKQAPGYWPLWGLYWTGIGLLMWIKARPSHKDAARAILWALRDGWAERFGNRHELFHK